MRLTQKISLLLTTLCAVVLSACTTPGPSNAELDQLTQKILASSFRAQGQAQLDRIQPDEDNRLCAEADRTGVALDNKISQAIEARNMATIKPPSNGNYLGDWKEGEKLAQDGRGKTWTDPATMANGGNCYNCHQISKEELSYGTLGPSLYQYGKIRGVADPSSSASKPIVEYTWGKLVNSRAYNACSSMPRFGHKGILTEAQIQHIMALLLDPASPINR